MSRPGRSEVLVETREQGAVSGALLQLSLGGELVAAEGELYPFDAAARLAVEFANLRGLLFVNRSGLRTADHSDAAGARELADAVGLEHLDEPVDLVLVADDLERERVR